MGFEEALLTTIWAVEIRNNTLTLFADTRALICHQKFIPMTRWDAVSKQLEVFTLFWAVFLGDASCHTEIKELEDLVDKTEGVSARFHVQSQHQPDFFSTLLHLVQYEFNESSRQDM